MVGNRILCFSRLLHFMLCYRDHKARQNLCIYWSSMGILTLQESQKTELGF